MHMVHACIDPLPKGRRICLEVCNVRPPTPTHLVPQVRKAMQANLNGYIQLPAVLDPGVDNFIVPSAHGNKAGMVRGHPNPNPNPNPNKAGMVRGALAVGGGGGRMGRVGMGWCGGVCRVPPPSPKTQDPASNLRPPSPPPPPSPQITPKPRWAR